MIQRLCSTALLLCIGSVTAETVRDDLGNALPDNPGVTRVVTLSPHTTEILLAAGGAPLLVGAASHDQQLPANVAHLSTLGGVDREQLLQLSPDLVVAWASGNRPGDIAWLRRQGIRVFLSEPQDMQQLAASIRAVGRLIGKAAQAERAASRFLRRLQQACAPDQSREVYLAIWDRPAMSVGGRHWINDALRLAGLDNTFANVDRGVFAVEQESLLSKKRLLQLTTGAADGQLQRQLSIESLSRPGPSLAQGMEDLCQRLKSSGN